jgi:hypothetical protein
MEKNPGESLFKELEIRYNKVSSIVMPLKSAGWRDRKERVIYDQI